MRLRRARCHKPHALRGDAARRRHRHVVRGRSLAFESLEPRRVLSGIGIAAATSWNGAEGEAADPKVLIRLAVTDPQGNTLQSIGIGESAFLTVSAQDVRPPTDVAGVFAAYLDVLYDANLIGPRIDTQYPLGFDIRFDDQYTNGKSGDAATPGLLDEVGAFQTGYNPLGSAAHTVFRVPFDATSIVPVHDVITDIAEDSTEVMLDVLANDRIRTGTVVFSGSLADVRPEHAVLLYDPPQLLPDSDIGFADTQLEVTRTGRDVITGVTQPTHGGNVRVSADGNRLLYTPAPNFHGKETFTYGVVSGQSAQVTVLVDPVNDPPVAHPDAYTVGRNQTLNVTAAFGLLANDTDVDGDPLSVARLTDHPEHGSVAVAADGSFHYVPDTDYRGADHFAYTITDGQAESQPATVDLNVGPPQLEIRLALTDADGQPVAQWTEGTPLQLETWVEDLRDPSYPVRGVSAAYLDITYDADDVTPIRDPALPLGFQVIFGPGFQDPGQGNADTDGLIDEVGSFRPFHDPSQTDSQLLLKMPIATTGPRTADDVYAISYQSRANTLDVLTNDLEMSWPVTVSAEPADNSPASDVEFVAPPGPVSPLDIRYRETTITVSNRRDLTITGVGAPDHGGQVSITQDGQHVNYAPAAGFSGDETFSYTILDAENSQASGRITVHVIPTWHHLRNPWDVNDDGRVSPVDALIVVNDLNENSSHALDAPPRGAPFLDVNNDAHVTPHDALLVINELNRRNGEGGEGEPAVPSTRPLSALPLNNYGGTSSNTMRLLHGMSLPVPAPPSSDTATRALDQAIADLFDAKSESLATKLNRLLSVSHAELHARRLAAEDLLDAIQELLQVPLDRDLG